MPYYALSIIAVVRGQGVLMPYLPGVTRPVTKAQATMGQKDDNKRMVHRGGGQRSARPPG